MFNKWLRTLLAVALFAAYSAVALVAVRAATTSTTSTSTYYTMPGPGGTCPSGYTYISTTNLCMADTTTATATTTKTGTTYSCPTSPYSYYYDSSTKSCKLCPPPRSNPSPGQPKTNPPCP